MAGSRECSSDKACGNEFAHMGKRDREAQTRLREIGRMTAEALEVAGANPE